jgi:hypothetical protein
VLARTAHHYVVEHDPTKGIIVRQAVAGCQWAVGSGQWAEIFNLDLTIVNGLYSYIIVLKKADGFQSLQLDFCQLLTAH